MRSAFAHSATVIVAPDADARALGGAVTVALCGHWEHEPPCRWPHHTSTAPIALDGALLVRTVFACAPADEAQVRGLISAALATPTEPAAWRLVSQHADVVAENERELADRLSSS